MKVGVKEALVSLKALQELTGPTIRYVEKLTETEFEVEVEGEQGARGHIGPGFLISNPCFVPPLPADFRRMAAASVLLARFLGAVL